MLNPALHLNEKMFEASAEQTPTRQGFGDGLVVLGDQNPNVVALCADLTESTKVEPFAKKYPNRFFECGVAEQNMAAVAAGLAVSGKIAFIASYATFSPGKNWETIRTTTVYNHANVKIAGHHSGVVTGPDGATHQATEDIAITRCWPKMVVIVPCDHHEASRATIAAGQTQDPTYLRFTRDKTPIITTPETPFQIGKAHVFWTSDKPLVTIIGTGHLLYHALVAARELEVEQIQTEVINLATIKPLDGETILASVKKTGAVITVEDHQVEGGMGSAVAEFLARTNPTPQEFIGLQNTFAESGKPRELIEKYGLGKETIKEAVKKALGRKLI